MDAKFNLVFDEVILKQLRKAGEDAGLRTLLSKSFDKLEVLGPRAGKLLDSKLFLYELKIKRPPVRIYFSLLLKQVNCMFLSFK